MDNDNKQQGAQNPEAESLETGSASESAQQNTPATVESPASANETPEVSPDIVESYGVEGKKGAKGPGGLFERFTRSSNLYLSIFVLILVGTAVAGFILIKTGNKQSATKTTSTATSLTSQELSSIKGSTTVVGDAKQILDIQSSAIFEGQILARNGLEVARDAKIGGDLTAGSIKVNGAATFGSLQANSLDITGDGNIEGQLDVHKDLIVGGNGSFSGALSASKLSVSTLSIKSDLTFAKHIVPSGTPPSKTTGTGLGSGGTASISGTDTAGTVTINTGGSPSASCYINVTFSQAFAKTPHVVISPANSASSTINYYATRSSSGFSVCSSSAPASGTTYVFDYIAID